MTYLQMPSSPSQAMPPDQDEEEEDRSPLLTDSCPDIGNLHMKKFDLSFKYHEAKFVEASIMGRVPSVLQDMGRVELEEKLGERVKRIEKSLKDVSKAYGSR